MGMPVRQRVVQARKPAPVSKQSVRQRAPRQGSGQELRQNSEQVCPAARERRQKPRSNQSESQFPAFTRCTLVGPDGTQRPGWEMWVGKTLFGRADSKETLLQYYARLHEPMPSGHWRERSWYPHGPYYTRFRKEEKEGEALDLGEASDSGLDPPL